MSKYTGKRLRIFFCLVLSIMLIQLFGCSQEKIPKTPINYNQLKDIDIQLRLDKIKLVNIDDKPNVFLYFHYKIDNHSKTKTYFDPGKVRIKANGISNTSTYYGESMGSAVTEDTLLPDGVSTYYLYAVYPNPNLQNGIKDISIERSGITVEAFKS